NRKNVEAHSNQIPEAFQEIIDEPTYRKSVQYTLAKGKLSRLQITWETVVLLAVLGSGFLPWSHGVFLSKLGASVWSMAAFLLAVGVVLSLPALPLAWYAQFRLE